VTAVRLKVGACSGIMADSLEFSFQVITAHTPLRTAKLEIETVPFRIQCLKCSNVNESDIGDRTCTTCGTKDTKIISGTDLHITEIEVEESKVQQP
jgi:hydrogenase nickel incorporation protein HypA/HybF